MAASQEVSSVLVEEFEFPPWVKAPGSDKHFFLGGAGVRGLEIEGKFVKFTAVGIYLEESALPVLAAKWKGKSSHELAHSVHFFRDIVTGPFEKLTQVSMILPLSGQQYSEKVAEKFVEMWKLFGIYTDDEAKAIEKFLQVFKDQNFPPSSSILYTQSPLGSLTIAFSKHDSIPEAGNAVIENKHLSESVLESMIGKHGISPSTKQSLAARLSDLLNNSN